MQFYPKGCVKMLPNATIWIVLILKQVEENLSISIVKRSSTFFMTKSNVFTLKKTYIQQFWAFIK